MVSVDVRHHVYLLGIAIFQRLSHIYLYPSKELQRNISALDKELRDAKRGGGGGGGGERFNSYTRILIVTVSIMLKA